jgi:hypothetical protein
MRLSMSLVVMEIKKNLKVHRASMLCATVWSVMSCLGRAEPGASNSAAPVAMPNSGNEAALKLWQSVAGDQVPAVIAGDKATSKIEWRSTVTTDAYTNDIKPPPAAAGAPPTATPLNKGNFATTNIASDIRLIEPSGEVTAFQVGVTASNDRAILSRYPNQVRSLAFGRTGSTYQVGAGDATVGYSQLGTTLGLRGLSIQKALGDWTVSGYSGVVTDSWEALFNRSPLDNGPARNRYTRSVAGTKAEYALQPGLKLFATAQGYRDSADSIPDQGVGMPPSDARAVSTGMAYQVDGLSVSSEAASSKFDARDQPVRRGSAYLLDAAYKLPEIGFRAGYHSVAPSFVSLSLSVPPGLREGFLGGDWNAASWLVVGSEYRESSNRTISLTPSNAEPLQPMPPMNVQLAGRSRTITNRANITFGGALPGLSAMLASNRSVGADPSSAQRLSQTSSAALSFNSATWNATFSANNTSASNSSNPQADSESHMLQAQFGRNYMGTIIPWTFGWTLMGAQQSQRMTFLGTESKSRSRGITVNGNRSDWAQFALIYQEAYQTQAAGGPELATHSLQIELTKKYGQQNALKAYLRQSQRNVGDAALRTDERVFGMQVNWGW